MQVKMNDAKDELMIFFLSISNRIPIQHCCPYKGLLNLQICVLYTINKEIHLIDKKHNEQPSTAATLVQLKPQERSKRC